MKVLLYFTFNALHKNSNKELKLQKRNKGQQSSSKDQSDSEDNDSYNDPDYHKQWQQWQQ